MSLDSLQSFTKESSRKQLMALICIDSTIFYFLSPNDHVFFYLRILYGTSHHYSHHFQQEICSKTNFTLITGTIH